MVTERSPLGLPFNTAIFMVFFLREFSNFIRQAETSFADPAAAVDFKVPGHQVEGIHGIAVDAGFRFLQRTGLLFRQASILAYQSRT